MHWLRQFIGPEKNTNRQSRFSLPPCPCREGWATRQTGLFTPACPGPWSGQLTNGTMKHSVHSPLSPTQAKWRHPIPLLSSQQTIPYPWPQHVQLNRFKVAWESRFIREWMVNMEKQHTPLVPCHRGPSSTEFHVYPDPVDRSASKSVQDQQSRVSGTDNI